MANKKIIYSYIIIIVLIVPVISFAASPPSAMNRLTNVGAGEAGAYEPITADNDLPAILGLVVAVFLSLLAVIFIILMLYGGYNWMISSGDEQKLNQAKDTIRTAIIGLIIVVGSYAIWAFVKNALGM